MGRARTQERLQPPLSTRRADVSFVVSVSRAGMTSRRNGEGGAGGGKNLSQLQSWLGNVARNVNRGSSCNKECFHHFLKEYMSIIKIFRQIRPGVECPPCCGSKAFGCSHSVRCKKASQHQVTQQGLFERTQDLRTHLPPFSEVPALVVSYTLRFHLSHTQELNTKCPWIQAEKSC